MSNTKSRPMTGTEEPTSSSIEINNLSKIYNNDTEEPVVALNDIDLSFAPNEFVSIIGPSGCGKTTLLKCIGDLIEPTEGEVLVGGQAVSTARRNRQLAFFFQEDVLLPWRTVLENVLLPLQIQKKNTSDPSVRQQAKEILNTVGLSGFEDRLPAELSGGMRQRVALARGFIFDPEIYLMDEPFAALDELTRREMNSELLRIHRDVQKTTVFVTHHITEAVWLSDKIVVLSPRPGEVDMILDIDLSRPRDESIRTSKKFREYEEQLTTRIMELGD